MDNNDKMLAMNSGNNVVESLGMSTRSAMSSDLSDIDSGAASGQGKWTLFTVLEFKDLTLIRESQSIRRPV